MHFLGELWALTRFEHALMLAIAVLIGETIVLGSFPGLGFIIILSLVVPMLSEAGSFALNDYFDLETDRINKKLDRPLVRGTIIPKTALLVAVAGLSLSTALAWLINLPAFLIAALFNLLAVLYNWKLKDLPLLGNLYIAASMAVPFIFGNFVVSASLSLLAVILAALGFLFGLAREITKSIQDMEGDVKARNSKTLPVVLGEKNSLLLTYVLYAAFMPLSILPFFVGLKAGAYPVFLIAAANACVLFNLFLLAKYRDYAASRKLTILSLFIGLLGLLLAVL